MAVTTHLREVRKSKGLTQKEVAEALLISKDSLSRYERGEQDPRLEVAIRLSKYYEVSMEQLYEINSLKIKIPNFRSGGSAAPEYS